MVDTMKQLIQLSIHFSTTFQELNGFNFLYVFNLISSFSVLYISILDKDIKESSHMSHLEETERVMEVVGQFFTQ